MVLVVADRTPFLPGHNRHHKFTTICNISQSEHSLQFLALKHRHQLRRFLLTFPSVFQLHNLARAALIKAELIIK